MKEHSSMALGAGCLLICLLCLLIGSGLIYSTFWYPASMRRAATQWVEAPCVLEKCSYRSRSSSSRSSNMKTLQVEYRYEFDGRSYRSDRVDFVLGDVGSMSIEGEDYVRDFPPGSRTVCHVNPENPAEAVLLPSRAAPAAFWLMPVLYLSVGCLPLLLLVSFGFLMWRADRPTKTHRRR